MSSVDHQASARPDAVAYLDHAASSPTRPEALEAMLETSALVGNPSGSHRWAREARRRLDDARDTVADLVGAEPGEVVFTSGGTESDNLAVRGVLRARGGVAVCSAVEHHAVLDTVEATGGFTLPVDAAGRVDFDDYTRPQGLTEPAEAPKVTLVSVMLANNETGVINDLEAVAGQLERHFDGAVLHTDAVAAAAWLDLRVAASSAQLVSISGHKFGAPKGIGALIVRRGTPLRSIMTGGGQEHDRRSGTQNVAGAVALASALAAAAAERVGGASRVPALRERLRTGLLESVPGLVETVPPAVGASHTAATLHVCIPGVEREALLYLIDDNGVAASWGSSCASGAAEPSHVLAAMGVGRDVARGAIRFSLGWSSTDADVDHALAVIPAAVAQLRGVAVEPVAMRARS